jgi:hypothetical protein
MKLQGKKQNVSSLFGHVNGFRNKLKLFKTAIERNDLTHFPWWKKITEELSNYEGSDFSTFVSNIEGMLEANQNQKENKNKLVNIRLHRISRQSIQCKWKCSLKHLIR